MSKPNQTGSDWTVETLSVNCWAVEALAAGSCCSEQSPLWVFSLCSCKKADKCIYQVPHWYAEVLLLRYKPKKPGCTVEQKTSRVSLHDGWKAVDREMMDGSFLPLSTASSSRRTGWAALCLCLRFALCGKTWKCYHIFSWSICWIELAQTSVQKHRRCIYVQQSFTAERVYYSEERALIWASRSVGMIRLKISVWLTYGKSSLFY